ncbi:hypothetical protein [Candidatus Frankia alpina]|uniref:hypothetical protein n=1 Tax=Candidatus Frankia alpina TaxID=2699483 RepID=UPI0013D1EC7C|nr:hypothetical protein [Candidatus Frankia alpina]
MAACPEEQQRAQGGGDPQVDQAGADDGQDDVRGRQVAQRADRVVGRVDGLQQGPGEPVDLVGGQRPSLGELARQGGTADELGDGVGAVGVGRGVEHAAGVRPGKHVGPVDGRGEAGPHVGAQGIARVQGADGHLRAARRVPQVDDARDARIEAAEQLIRPERRGFADGERRDVAR